MITQDDVINAYRFILGRSPEGEPAIKAHLGAATVNDLRRTFLKSKEFEENWLSLNPMAQAPAADFAPPLDWNENPIEVGADPVVMGMLLDRIRNEWEAFGREDPHWSAVTHDDFRKPSIDKNRASFYATGAIIPSIVRSFCHRNGLDLNAYKVCLELGCGVGRITYHLAKMFPSVIGTDISASHLAVCRQELISMGVSNVTLTTLSSVAHLDALPRFDFFVSFIVLQHNPPPVIKLILKKILEKLNPGGAAVFQLPVYQKQYSFRLKEYLEQPTGMEMHVLPQRHVLATIREAGCELREIREDDFGSGRSANSLSNTFFVTKNR